MGGPASGRRRLAILRSRLIVAIREGGTHVCAKWSGISLIHTYGKAVYATDPRGTWILSTVALHHSLRPAFIFIFYSLFYYYYFFLLLLLQIHDACEATPRRNGPFVALIIVITKAHGAHSWPVPSSTLPPDPSRSADRRSHRVFGILSFSISSPGPGKSPSRRPPPHPIFSNPDRFRDPGGVRRITIYFFIFKKKTAAIGEPEQPLPNW